jgi:organic radical activating enzyme
VTAPSISDDILATEVFSAIQGEAALVGERQVFVRLTGCNIRCAYCDQPEALEKRPGPCRIEQTPGRRDWKVVASPLPISTLAAAVERLWQGLPHHSISLTGGEPLLQSARVAQLAERLAAGGRPVMLETNGTLVPALERTLPWLTYVSMDLKLPSVDSQRVAPETQRTFLHAALRPGVTTWLKMVVGPSTDLGQFDSAIAMVSELSGAGHAGPGTGRSGETDRRPEIFLQPVTPFGGVAVAPTPDQVLELQERALRRYPRVRVIPQTHKAIGQL